MMEALPPVATTRVEFLLAGEFPYSFPDPYGWEVETRDVGTLLADPRMREDLIANRSFAFSFYDVVTVTVEDVPGVEGPVIATSHRVNESKLHYLGGQIMDREEVAAIPDSDTLLEYMEDNGCAAVIRCRLGNFQPFDPAEHVLVATEISHARKLELLRNT